MKEPLFNRDSFFLQEENREIETYLHARCINERVALKTCVCALKTCVCGCALKTCVFTTHACGFARACA